MMSRNRSQYHNANW